GESFGGRDAFAAMYDTNGELLWVRHVGTMDNEASYGDAADGHGNLYLSGNVAFDVFLAKIRYRDDAVPGDTNGDGAVDLADLNNVRNDFGIAGDGIPGDVNDDLIVDLEDLNAVRDHFGESV